MPIFHALGLLSDMGDRYWVLPERVANGNVTSGFASRDEQGVIRILLYAHHSRDTQSRSETSFDVTLDLDGIGWAGPAQVQEYRFDRDHNSPFPLAHATLHWTAPGGQPEATRLAEVKKAFETDDPAVQLRALESVKKLAAPTRQAALEVVFKLAGQAKDQRVATQPRPSSVARFGPVAYPTAEVEEIRKKSECHSTGTSSLHRQANGHLRLTVHVASNGCNFIVIKRDGVLQKGDGPDR